MARVLDFPQTFSRVKLASPRETIMGTKLFMYNEGTKVKKQAVTPRSRLKMEIPR